MKEKLLKDFNIVRMNRGSLTLENKNTKEKVFITKSLFNNLDNVEEISISDPFGDEPKWIEGRYWSRF